MKPETIRLLRRIMFLYFVPWLYFDVAGMLAMTGVYYLPLISYTAHPYRDSYPGFVSDWFLEFNARRGDDKAGTGSFSYLSEASCKLDTRSFHVLEIRRVVDMAHDVNVPELNRQINTKLQRQSSLCVKETIQNTIPTAFFKQETARPRLWKIGSSIRFIMSRSRSRIFRNPQLSTASC